MTRLSPSSKRRSTGSDVTKMLPLSLSYMAYSPVTSPTQGPLMRTPPRATALPACLNQVT